MEYLWTNEQMALKENTEKPLFKSLKKQLQNSFSIYLN